MSLSIESRGMILYTAKTRPEGKTSKQSPALGLGRRVGWGSDHSMPFGEVDFAAIHKRQLRIDDGLCGRRVDV